MIHRHRTFRLASPLLAIAWLWACQGRAVQAQWGGLTPGGAFELSEAVQLDQADHAVLAQLERVKTLLADHQWDEAIEILRRQVETSEGKLLAVAPRRYVSLREWCQLQLAALPPEALRLYRGRVDPMAQKWYERGIADHDRQWLQRVVDQALASSWGDDALMALGEMAFESGDFAAARWYWERIVPAEKGSGVRGQGSVVRDQGSGVRDQGSGVRDQGSGVRDQGSGVRDQGSGVRDQGSGASSENKKQKSLTPDPSPLTPSSWPLPPSTWPGYPDTKLDLAAVRARLVLASILEGATRRARAELIEFTRLHPDAQGRLGGRKGRYVELLRTLLAESAAWPPTPLEPDGPTFAGNPRRNKIAPPPIDFGAVAWRVPLEAERGAGLCFHPIVQGNLVLAHNGQQLLAVRSDTGKPAWGQTAAIYQPELAGAAGQPAVVSDALGSPQYTMTAFQGRLFARMGVGVDRPTARHGGGRSAGLPGLLGFVGPRTAAVEGRAGRGLGLRRLAGGRPARRLRGHAASRHPAAGIGGLFRA